MPTTKSAPRTTKSDRAPFTFTDNYARREHEQVVAIGLTTEWRLRLEQCDGDPMVYITGTRFSLDDGVVSEGGEGKAFTLDIADVTELPAILAGLSRLVATLEKDALAK